MVKKNKLVLGLTLGALALGCATFAFAQQTSVDYSPLREAASDTLDGSPSLNVRELEQIGDGELSVSKTFVQYGVDDLGNYCMRFATAVKGPVSSMQYTRKGIAGVKDGQDVVKQVNDVYVGITAEDHVFYYDGEDVTTKEAYKGLYYWACYTISFASAEYYDLGIEVVFSVEGVEVSSRESSLNEAIQNGNPAPSAYAITSVANDDVQVSVAEAALPGAVVEVDLSYDVNAVHVRKVLANDVECGLDGDGNYYFVMPNQDVELTVVSEKIAKTKRVVNLSEGVVTLHGVGTNAPVGERVSFTLSVAPGYSFGGEVVVREYDAFDPEMAETYEVSYENGVYSFVMPNRDVEVSVSVVKGVYRLSKLDPNSLLNTVYSNGTSVRDGYAEYGSTIKVTFSSSNKKYAASGVRVVETGAEYMLSGSATSVEFQMPYYGITIEPIATPVYRQFELINSAHITLTAYTKDAEGNYVPLAENKEMYDEKVYLKAVSEDEETYVINKVEGVYYSGANSYSYTSSIYPSLNADGYHEFTMPEVRNGTVLTITVTEKDMSLFKDADFIGKYLGANPCSNYAYTNTSSSYSPSIDASGILQKGTSQYQITNITQLAHAKELSLSNGKSAMVGGNIIVGHYSFSGLAIGPDMLVGIKKLNESDPDSSYTYRVEMFNNRLSTVITGYKDGELYAAGYVDGEKGVAYLEDVEIVMTSGEYVTDDKASYTIMVDGAPLTKVGYTGTGGAKNRVLIDSYKGEYTSAEGATLSLDGSGSATYNGETYAYETNDEGQVVLTKDLDVITVEVDFATNSFSVVSQNVYERLDELDLKTFKGTCVDNYDDSYVVALKFVGNGKVKYTVTSGSIDYIGSNVTESQTEQTSYVLDKETMTLTINIFIYGSSSSTVEVSFSVAEDFNSLTHTSGIPGASNYHVNGQTLSVENA